ncbi:unnamed protein product [Diamesa tonsa]
MQLMTFNSLLMFDIVFIFFLFLIAVTCLMYYLPPSKIRKIESNRRRRNSSRSNSGDSDEQSVIYVNANNEPIESFMKCCKYCEKCKIIYEEIYSERSYMMPSTSASSMSPSSSNSKINNGTYLKAKQCDIKNCKGPVYEV